jgi:hypothetical protein
MCITKHMRGVRGDRKVQGVQGDEDCGDIRVVMGILMYVKGATIW